MISMGFEQYLYKNYFHNCKNMSGLHKSSANIQLLDLNVCY